MSSLSDTEFSKIQAKFDHELFFLGDFDSFGSYENIENILSLKGVKYSLDEIRNYVEQAIRQQITVFAIKQFLLMVKTENFSVAGQENVTEDFCRILLNIPPEQELQHSHAEAFQEKIDAYYLHLGSPNVEDLERQLKEFCFTIFGTNVRHDDADDLNKLLAFVQSENLIQCSWDNPFRSFIYGPLEPLEAFNLIYKDQLMLMQKCEIIRTPCHTLAYTAIKYPWGSLFRFDAFKAIFLMEWVKHYEQIRFIGIDDSESERVRFRAMLKNRALTAYDIRSREQLNKNENIFIQEMIEVDVWHQLGCEISLTDNKFLSVEYLGIGASVSQFNDNAITAIRIALPDWGTSGPILNFLRLNASDPKKAKRMLSVYLCDNCHFSSFEDGNLNSTGEILLLLAFSCVPKSGELDYTKLKVLQPEIYEFLTGKYIEGVEGVLEIIKNAKYEVSQSHSCTYADIYAELIKLYRKDQELVNVPEGRILAFSAFWKNMVGYLRKFAPRDHDNLEQYLATFTEKFKFDLFYKLMGNEVENTNANISEYLLRRI